MVVRRLTLSSLFHTKTKDVSPSSHPLDPAAAPAWAWPSCKHPRTESFHVAAPPGATTIASIFLHSAETFFTNSSAQPDCSGNLFTASEASAGADTVDDAIVRGLRSSDRLLFDPGASATSSKLEKKSAAAADGEAFVGGLAVAFESVDPYVDFRSSMEEMVAAHGLGDWGWLEEILGWFLRANGKDTHGAIVAAFVDAIVTIADPARASCSSRSSSCTFTEGEVEVPEKD